MADHYIGRSPVYGVFETQILTPDSVTTSFNLTYSVGSAGSIFVVYGGVLQLPNVAYSIGGGGSTIVFSEAPVTGTTLYLVYAGKQLTVPRTAGQEVATQSFTGDGTTATFTLTTPPVGSAGAMIFVDGILQKLTSNFSIVGNSLIFTAAPDSGAEIDVYTLVQERVSVDVPSNGVVTRAKLGTDLTRTVAGIYSITSTSATVAAGNYYMIDTTAAALTMTLPTVAILGDTIRFIDLSGTFATNNLTIARNGHKIQRSTTDLTVNTTGAAFDLVYSNPTNGWIILPV